MKRRPEKDQIEEHTEHVSQTLRTRYKIVEPGNPIHDLKGRGVSDPVVYTDEKGTKHLRPPSTHIREAKVGLSQQAWNMIRCIIEPEEQ